MFKKKRGIHLTYYKQGLIYFLCSNYYNLPDVYREMINKICDEVAGEYSDALFALLTGRESNAMCISMKYFVSDKRLYKLRAHFYEEFWKQAFVKEICETIGAKQERGK